MAEVEGFHFEEVLTGFKWIGNKAIELDEKGYKTFFSYEEAIGHCVGNLVRDKDGVCAASVIAQLYVKLCQEGTTFYDYLQNIYKKYGYFVTKNYYFINYDKSKMAQMFAEIRQPQYPESVGKYKIKYIRDLTDGYDNSKPDNKPVLPVSKSSEMITFIF
mgnify:FL=1